MILGERIIRNRQVLNIISGPSLVLCLIGLFITGCIAVPTPAKHKVRGQAFTDTSPPLTQGKTTREEILASLGPPTAIWEEENVWIYGWDQSKSGWFALFPGGAMGYFRNWENKIFLLRFNGQGVLVDWKTGDRPKLTDTGQFLMAWVSGEGSRKQKLLVEEHNKTPVLLRLVTNTDGLLDEEWDEKWFDGMYDGIAVRLGGFGTGGLVRERGVKKKEKIERNLWYEGWQLYYIEPGDLYFAFFHMTQAFSSPGGYIDDEFAMPPVFHIDVPISDTPIYLGTFHFDRRTFIEASWNQNGVYRDYRFVGIADESDISRQVAGKLFPEGPDPETSIAVMHEGPVIITSPPDLN